MRLKVLLASGLLALAIMANAQEPPYPKAKVSFDDFKQLVAEVEAHRAQRLIDLDAFLKMSKEPDTIILDTRSTFRFDRIHLKGARHLSFTDFTQENLNKSIPSFETRVLIYCNNNFEGNQTDFASKVATPQSMSGRVITAQFNAQAKPLMMALNIPTYINLYGYGYHNVYELHELVNVNDPRIVFEGSIVAPPKITDAEQEAGVVRESRVGSRAPQP
jgi:rhodanese-related sulfurtransferase